MPGRHGLVTSSECVPVCGAALGAFCGAALGNLGAPSVFLCAGFGAPSVSLCGDRVVGGWGPALLGSGGWGPARHAVLRPFCRCGSSTHVDLRRRSSRNSPATYVMGTASASLPCNTACVLFFCRAMGSPVAGARAQLCRSLLTLSQEVSGHSPQPLSTFAVTFAPHWPLPTPRHRAAACSP